jgi:hypothetical protein
VFSAFEADRRNSSIKKFLCPGIVILFFLGAERDSVAAENSNPAVWHILPKLPMSTMPLFYRLLTNKSKV